MKGMSSVWRAYAKVFPFMLGLVIFVFLATGVHEQFHNIAAKALDVGGYVTFNWWSGYFVYADPSSLTWGQDFTIGLCGGLGTALVFGLLWLIEHWQAHYSEWELDNVFIAGIMTVSQFVYAFADGLDTGEQTWGNIGGGLAAFVICGLLYGKRVWKWINTEE